MIKLGSLSNTLKENDKAYFFPNFPTSKNVIQVEIFYYFLS